MGFNALCLAPSNLVSGCLPLPKSVSDCQSLLGPVAPDFACTTEQQLAANPPLEGHPSSVRQTVCDLGYLWSREPRAVPAGDDHHHDTSDVLVCLDCWVGMIRTVNSKLTAWFTYKVILDDTVTEEIDDIRDKSYPECEFKRNDFCPEKIIFGPSRYMYFFYFFIVGLILAVYFRMMEDGQ